MKMSVQEIIEAEKKVWTRSAPADLYYAMDPASPLTMKATKKLGALLDAFEASCIRPAEVAREQYPYQRPTVKRKVTKGGCSGGGGDGDHQHSSSPDDSCSDSDTGNEKKAKKEKLKMKKYRPSAKDDSFAWLEHRMTQPDRLDKELWGNREGEANDGLACRCSLKSRKVGIRHGIYQGEVDPPVLDPATNNSDKLYHYRITISPPTNFLVTTPTQLRHDGHDFIFEGFSLFATQPIEKDMPLCKVVRFNIEYTVLFFEEKVPNNFTLRELRLFHRYFFKELLELYDWDVTERYFFMPRFVRELSEDGKEILSMNEVIRHLIDSRAPVVADEEIAGLIQMSAQEWLDFADGIKGMVVTNPGRRPAAIRVDQVDREQDDPTVVKYPELVHSGTRPPQMCFAGNPEYQKAYREFVKFRHLLANMAKPSYKDKRKLEALETKLTELRNTAKLKRDVTIAVSCQVNAQGSLSFRARVEL